MSYKHIYLQRVTMAKGKHARRRQTVFTKGNDLSPRSRTPSDQHDQPVIRKVVRLEQTKTFMCL